MIKEIPAMILTGASGIVGGNFLLEARDRFYIYALARRTQKEAGVEHHPNIQWIQVDIGNRDLLERIVDNIRKKTEIDYILHLAGYYDFDLVDNPEYQRTNIRGTRHMLEQAKRLKVKRFVFASTTAACEFPPPGESISETSELDADYAYARSKREGEKMLKEFSPHVPCSSVRFAAVFTDWGDYAPLYNFLNIWLSRKWKSRVLGGRGESAVTFIHPRNLNRLLTTIFQKSAQLPDYDVYIASPDGYTTHGDLFQIATWFYFKKKRAPVYMPKILSYLGVVVLSFLGKLVGKRPFERPWMIKYLDRILNTSSSLTRQKLSFKLDPAYHIRRRLPHLISNKFTRPEEWHQRNQKILHRVTTRPNLVLFEGLLKVEGKFNDPADTESPLIRRVTGLLYRLLCQAVLRKEPDIILKYTRSIARLTKTTGIPLEEVCRKIKELEDLINSLLQPPEAWRKKGGVYWTQVTLTFQSLLWEIEYAYSDLDQGIHPPQPHTIEEIEGELGALEEFYKKPLHKV